MSLLKLEIDLTDDKGLDLAQALLEAFRNNGNTKPVTKTAKPDAPKTDVAAPAPVDSAPATETADEDITVEDLRKAVEPIAKTKRAELKALITQFGVDKLPDIPVTRRAEFIEKVKTL